MATRVYKFRVLGDLPQEAIEELFRAHRLQNQMVEIEHRYSERVAAVWLTRPELAEAEAIVQAQEAVVEDLVERAKKARQAAVSTDIGPELRTELRDARAALREARAERKRAKEEAYPVVKPLHAEAASQRKEEIKALYAPAIEGGLYWATFNDVRDHHETARRNVRKTRAEGSMAELRFRRWQGTGTLTVQLQRQADDPPRTPMALSGPSKWRRQFQLTPVHNSGLWKLWTSSQRRQSRLGTLRFRIGSGEHSTLLSLPVLVHRPIPEEADIPLARLTRRTVAGKPIVTVSIAAKLPDVPARTEGLVVAAHLGWRSRGDGSLRVAVVAGAGPVPESLRDVVLEQEGWCEVILPAKWRDKWEHSTKLRSQRDLNRDTMARQALQWLATHEVTWPDDFLDLTHIAQWRSPARWAKLALRLREEYVEGTEGLSEILWPWRRQDKHLFSWHANQTEKMIARRDEAYQRVAKWMCSSAAIVAVDEWKTDWVRVPGVDQVDPEADRKARANRVQAAPATLRMSIANAASAQGAMVIAGMATSVHTTCGHKLDAVERKSSVYVFCTHCQVMVDQDHNALMQLMANAMTDADER